MALKGAPGMQQRTRTQHKRQPGAWRGALVEHAKYQLARVSWRMTSQVRPNSAPTPVDQVQPALPHDPLQPSTPNPIPGHTTPRAPHTPPQAGHISPYIAQCVGAWRAKGSLPVVSPPPPRLTHKPTAQAAALPIKFNLRCPAKRQRQRAALSNLSVTPAIGLFKSKGAESSVAGQATTLQPETPTITQPQPSTLDPKRQT